MIPYRTIPVRARFTEEERLFWLDQCQHANSLINCAVYYTRQKHYDALAAKGNAFVAYWRGDLLHSGWKTWRCSVTYAELCKELKDNEHAKLMHSQAAQQTLKTVAEAITSYNALVKLYYENPAENLRPKLPGYRTKGGLAGVTYPKQALTFFEGVFYPSVSVATKPEMITEIGLQLPDFIDSDWVKEVSIVPKFGEFWVHWVIDDGKESIPLESNPSLDYTKAWGFDHGGPNWLTSESIQKQRGLHSLSAMYILKGLR